MLSRRRSIRSRVSIMRLIDICVCPTCCSVLPALSIKREMPESIQRSILTIKLSALSLIAFCTSGYWELRRRCHDRSCRSFALQNALTTAVADQHCIPDADGLNEQCTVLAHLRALNTNRET
jgi:hypothetical protein